MSTSNIAEEYTAEELLAPPESYLELNEKWDGYGILINRNRRKKNAAKFSIVHADLGKHEFEEVSEIHDWLIENEKQLAIKSQRESKNLLAISYARKRQAENPARTEEAVAPQPVIDFSEAAIAGVSEEVFFDDEDSLEVPDHIRDVLRRPNESFFASYLKPADELKEKLQALSFEQAKPFHEVVQLLKQEGQYVSGTPSRYEISSLLGEMGFCIRFFGDVLDEEQNKTLCCIAGSKY